MKFREFEKVRIKKTGLTGTIVDISRGLYIVESDVENPDIPGGYGNRFLLFDCKESEIEHIGPEDEKVT